MNSRRDGLSALGFVAVACLVVAGVEWLVRRAVDRVPLWYEAADIVAGQEDVGFVFVGSSRTGAAVLSQAFERALRRHGVKRGRALNLGRGETSWVEHYLGVRNLLTEHPERVRGLTLFVEAPAGSPGPAFWQSSWHYPEQQALLQEVLRWRDLPVYWSRSDGTPIQEKTAVSMRFALRGLVLIRRRERFREQLLGAGPGWLAARLAGSPAPSPFEAAPFGLDLQGSAAGGARPGAAFIAQARRLARQFGPPWATRKPWLHWDATVHADLVRLLREHGGSVCYFVVPLSSDFDASTPEREVERAAFAAWAAQIGSTVLWPSFEYDDRDLPDRWHLRGTRAAGFSRALARAWLEANPVSVDGRGGPLAPGP